MLLMCRSSLGLTLSHTPITRGPMTFTLTFVWTVRQRNVERTVLCMVPPLWKVNERPDMLFDIPVQGRPLPT